MITDRLQLKPLGGIYEKQFWPVPESAIAQLEQYLGRSLPESYVAFVTTYGTSRPNVDMMIDGPNGLVLGFDSFYGDPDSSPVTSVVKLSEQYPDLGRLTIGAEVSGLFFLAPDGSILFERSGVNERILIAPSFDDFVEQLRPDPTMA